MKPSSGTQSPTKSMKTACTKSFHIDGRSADPLADPALRAVQTGTFKGIRVLMILDARTLASKERLLKVNISLHTMWACTAVIMKPWTSRTKVDRRNDAIVPTLKIPGIAEEINGAASKMEKLLKSPNKFPRRLQRERTWRTTGPRGLQR